MSELMAGLSLPGLGDRGTFQVLPASGQLLAAAKVRRARRAHGAGRVRSAGGRGGYARREVERRGRRRRRREGPESRPGG